MGGSVSCRLRDNDAVLHPEQSTLLAFFTEDNLLPGCLFLKSKDCNQSLISCWLFLTARKSKGYKLSKHHDGLAVKSLGKRAHMVNASSNKKHQSSCTIYSKVKQRVCKVSGNNGSFRKETKTGGAG